MKTIAFRFEFRELKASYLCEAYRENESSPFYAKILALGPPPPKTGTVKHEQDLHGMNKAWLKVEAAIHPRSFGKMINPSKSKGSAEDRPGLTGFELFKQREIEQVQNWALDEVSLKGVIYAATNYTTAFFTAQHFQRMAKALHRPRKKIVELALKQWLVSNWENGLCKLTRNQLADKANSEFGTTFKPAMVWQTAYRALGLYTDRNPGPPSPR